MGNRLKLIKNYQVEHPNLEIHNEDKSWSAVVYDDNVDTLRKHARFAEGIKDHYESLINSDYVKREDNN